MATRLFSTVSVEEQWTAVTGPWLRAQAGAAWKNPKPTVILTPGRAESFYLRSRLVEEGVPFLGLRFWTPSDARKFLLAEIGLAVGAATLAEQRLVARACAESLVGEGDANNATLKSVVREPGAFLRAYDLLLGAGWNPAQSGAAYGRELAREMQRALEKYGIATQAGLHLLLRREVMAKQKALIANLLVVGFNATHWPLWDLLKALVFSAEEATVALSEPRTFGEDIDQLWISSWEEITATEVISPIRPISPISPILKDEPVLPFEGLVASYEKGAPGNVAGADLSFCVTPDLASQIRGVVLQALEYLKRDACTRLGIIFPEANALAMGVAEELRRLGIPLDNGTGSHAPGIFERRCWRSWIALQEEPGVPRLIAWVRVCEAQGVAFDVAEALPAREIAGLIDGALGDCLVDDLDFLARYLEESSTKREARPVAEFLRRRIALPEEATFAEFLGQTQKALALPRWDAYCARLETDPPEWLLKSKTVLTRRTFLEWLKETTDSQTWTSGPDGNHFYGKVHLTLYAQMPGQAWSHLILTGLNESIWPRVFEAGAFGSRHELMELNQQARKLNVASRKQGRQGEGHETVATDRGHCLVPVERQDLALRDLCVALEATSEAVCLAAMTTEGGRSLLPSDFFHHAYQAKMGLMLDEETFRELAKATADWCRRHGEILAGLVPLEGGTSPDDQRLPIEGTRIAYEARRDRTQPFGPYEFAFAEPPVQPIQLRCKRWEDAWNHPATVWLADIVGAASWPEGTLSWQRAVGTWAHRWLAVSLRECAERKSTAELPVLLWAAADREAGAARNRAREVGIDLYPWWDQVWAQARNFALGLAETTAPHLEGKPFLCELIVPPNLQIALPGTERADFELRGRLDLVVIEAGSKLADPARGDFTGCACWVIDFKTGAAANLTARKVGEGRGLQTVLYALAMRARGALSTAISLHTGDAVLKPQVQLDAVLGMAPLFRSLDMLHRKGVFGMRADADNAYGYSPAYPMATRFVPGNILEAKWALVHGAVADEEEA